MIPVDPNSSASTLRGVQRDKEDLADYIRRHEDEFDGFDPMEEDWIISVWPQLRQDLGE